MASDDVLIESFLELYFVVENLNVTEHPESYCLVEHWSHNQDLYGCPVQRFIEHGWLLIAVSK